jgi:transcription antitermination factor NusG
MFGGVSSSAQERRWYCVNTQPCMESRAEINLKSQGFEVAPLRRPKTIKHARRFQTVRVPLFPGYVFVSLDLKAHRWRAINGTLGVRNLIMAGERPSPAPRGVVEALMDLYGPGGRPFKEYAPGQRVRLLAGPFAEMLGSIDRLDDAGRVRVLLELLGARVPVLTTTDKLVLA